MEAVSHQASVVRKEKNNRNSMQAENGCVNPTHNVAQRAWLQLEGNINPVRKTMRSQSAK